MLTIVEQRPGDIHDLRALFLAGRQNTFSWLDTTQYTLLDFDRETQGEWILVALFHEKIIGFISVWLPDNFIHHLFVDAAYQHQHAGTALLNAAVQNMHFPVRLKCLKQNTAAVHFYRKKGFVEMETGIAAEGEYIVFALHGPPV